MSVDQATVATFPSRHSQRHYSDCKRASSVRRPARLKAGRYKCWPHGRWKDPFRSSPPPRIFCVSVHCARVASVTARRRGSDFGAADDGRSFREVGAAIFPDGLGRGRAEVRTMRRARTNRCCVRYGSRAWRRLAPGEDVGVEIRAPRKTALRNRLHAPFAARSWGRRRAGMAASGPVRPWTRVGRMRRAAPRPQPLAARE